MVQVPGPPPISPDGLTYWNGTDWESLLSSDGSKIWNGQGWTAYQPQVAEVSERPWWLHSDADMPELQVRSAAPPLGLASASPDLRFPEPAPAAANRAPLILGGALFIAALLMMGAVGSGLVQLPFGPSAVTTGTTGVVPTSSAAAATPAPVAATPPPTSAPAPAPASLPNADPTLTAQLDGEATPAGALGAKAAIRLYVLNTGRPIGQLAVIFITDPRSGDSNWFLKHSEVSFATYPANACRLDESLPGFVCGPLGAGAGVVINVHAVMGAVGEFGYAVKFADLAKGPTDYVNVHPDGTHDSISWTESVG